MKFLNIKIAILFLLGFVAFSACKKDKNSIKSEDVISTKDYVYNLAKKTLTPDASISASISSDVAIKYIYSYLLRDGKGDSLINIAYPTPEQQNDYTLNIPVTIFNEINMVGVSGIKNVTKRVDNSSSETFIKLTSFQPPLPVLANFPVSILPDDNNKIQVTGKATSLTGLNKIEILDDSKGSYEIVTTIANLAGAKTYDVNYTYTYRANTTSLKIIAYDTFDIKIEYIIKVPVLPFTLYQDLTMNAQGNVSNNGFIAETGKLLSSCELPANELNISFLFYGTSTNATFYVPTNATSIAKNYKCSGVSWTPADFTKLRGTRLRILTQGTTEIDNIYAKVASNSLPDLKDDGIFTGIAVPGSNTAKYDVTGTGVINLTNSYLVWAKVPSADGLSSKNCLLRIKQVTYDTASASSASVKLDIYVQK